jgi:hypothetical protein
MGEVKGLEGAETDGKRSIDGVLGLIERGGGGNTGKNTVFPGRPMGEVLAIIPDILALGMEEVGVVLGDADAVAIDEVVSVSADMVSFIEDENFLVKLGGESFGEDCTREPLR